MSETDLRNLAAIGPKLGSVWRHYKGDSYVVICTALRETDLTPVVVYRAHGDYNNVPFVRPLSEWNEAVKDDAGNQVARYTRT